MIERTLTWILACITLMILFIIYYYHYHKWYSFLEIARYPIKKYKEQKKEKEKKKQQIRSAFKLAEDYLHRELDNKYLNQSKYIEINYKAIKVKESYWPLANKVLSEFPLFYSLIKNENFKEEHNQEFIKNEKERCKLEYWSLTDAQQTAIFTDEDAVLVNAWAWTGKTKTIENKIKYLVKEKHIPLDKILVVTFSKASQQDMMERICNTLKIEWITYDAKVLKKTITTFHAFWKWVLDDYENIYLKNSYEKHIWLWRGTKRVMEDEEKTRIVNYTMSEIKKDPEISSMIYHYFFYYNKPIITEVEWDDTENRRKDRIDKYTTFMKSWKSNVVVKSYWELLIANYLVEHEINAQYEPDWHYFTTNDESLRNYKPDFYIPLTKDDGIYIEYFWVDKNNETAPWIDEDEYIENMEAKIEAHKKDHNKLIDIRYADLEEWRDYFIKKLESNLNSFWINTSKHVEIDSTIVKQEMTNLWRLLSSFHALYCECWLTRENIFERIEKLEKWERERAYKFFEIFEAYYEKYRQYLNKMNYMDFSDMITEARKYLHSWYVKREFSYILVDEFQDISNARAELLKALIKDRNNTRLFCVWDDWQSIYKFTGSDLWIFLDFKEYFWDYSYLKLDKTFRFNQWISNISWEFIMKNKFQKEKTLTALDPETKDKIKIFEREDVGYWKHDDSAYRKSIIDILEDYINHIPETERSSCLDKQYEISCLYLTRYSLEKYDYSIFDMLNAKHKPKQDEKWYLIYEIPYKDYNFVFKIKHLTVHKSKWLEADYVIVDYVNRRGGYTFPSKIDDDPILELCMTDNKYSYPFAEERRILYVAITRGKKKAYVLHDNNSESVFVRDLKVLMWWWKLSKNPKWAHCWKCWWDLVLSYWKLNQYRCINGCEWKYYAYEWRMYKARMCKCWKNYAYLRTDGYQPYWPCEGKHCRKYYKFRKNKFCIWYAN